MKEYTLKKLDSAYSAKILAIVFQDTEHFNSSSKHLDYIIRTDSTAFNSVKNFLNDNPFVQTQMCLDESFLNSKKPNSIFKSNVSIISR